MSRFPVGRKLVGELPWQTQSVASGVFLPRSAIEAAAETISPLRGRGRSAERLGRSAETAEPQDARALEDIGLRNLAHDEDSPAALAARDIPGEFEYHKQIGATSAYFSQTAHMERAIDRLSSDYVFIRDFQMSLPTPIKVDADEGPSTEPPDDASDLAWRDAAGINKAQKDDYTGQGILLGMLDTGIDADHTEFSGRSEINYPRLRPDSAAQARSACSRVRHRWPWNSCRRHPLWAAPRHSPG